MLLNVTPKIIALYLKLFLCPNIMLKDAGWILRKKDKMEANFLFDVFLLNNVFEIRVLLYEATRAKCQQKTRPSTKPVHKAATTYAHNWQDFYAPKHDYYASIMLHARTIVLCWKFYTFQVSRLRRDCQNQARGSKTLMSRLLTPGRNVRAITALTDIYWKIY